MGSLTACLIVFGCVFGGALLGMLLRSRLPEHHLSPDSKDVVKLATGVLGTVTAMVLGLLVASAKGSFDAQRAGVSQLAGNVLALDRTLAHYGPETKEAREQLRASVADLVERTWPHEGRPSGPAGRTAGRYEEVFERTLALQPKTDAQRAVQAQALKITADTGQMRWSLDAQEHGSSIPTLLVVVLVFWLALIQGGFGLFAPGNGTAVGALAVSALAVSCAVFLILEMDRPFTGVIEVSSAPLRHALEQLGR